MQTATTGQPIRDLRFEHNTMVFSEGELGQNSIALSSNGITNVDGLIFVNNVFDHGQFGFYTQLGLELINYRFSENGFFFHPGGNNYSQFLDQGVFDSRYPGNFKANTIDDVKFTDHANLDYTLANDSPFKGLAAGKDLGVDYTELNAALLGVL